MPRSETAHRRSRTAAGGRRDAQLRPVSCPLPGSSGRAIGVDTRPSPQEPHHGVPVLHHLAVFPMRRHGHLVASGVAQDEQSAGHDQSRQSGVVEQLLREGGRASADVLLPVRRVGENQVERLAEAGQLGKSGEGVLHADLEVI